VTELHEDLIRLLDRFRSELEYSDAKGSGPYRQGMHDGLHFAADALADLLAAHDVTTDAPLRSGGGIPRDYGV
jgi:hypothetical protein